MRNKITLIGGGNIGGTIAHLSGLHNVGEVVILDKSDTFANGKALDISQGLAIDGNNNRYIGTNNYRDISNSDVVIVTAGSPRKPGMSRDDLLEVNYNVISQVAINVKEHAGDAFVIIVTNPLDAMVYAFQKVSGLPHNRVVGMAGVLDTARFKDKLSRHMNISSQDITTLVLGGHGDTMVPLLRYTNIGGIPLDIFIKNNYITRDEIKTIVQETRDGGAEIVKLLKSGSAFYAPATAALEMAMSYILDKKRIIPCAAHLTGQYGVDDMYIGAPAVIGSNGVEKIIELPLNEDETMELNSSIEAVKILIDKVDQFGR